MVVQLVLSTSIGIGLLSHMCRLSYVLRRNVMVNSIQCMVSGTDATLRLYGISIPTFYIVVILMRHIGIVCWVFTFLQVSVDNKYRCLLTTAASVLTTTTLVLCVTLFWTGC